MKSKEGKEVKDIKKVIEEFCADNDLELVKNYSGHSMYGKTCYGIICDSLRALVALSDYIRDNGFESAYDALGNVDVDNMGYQKIFYFKKVV